MTVRLIKCRKCGTVISTNETFIEQMMIAMNEFTQKAATARSTDKIYYIQQASQIKSMIKQVQHLTGQIEQRKVTVMCELSEIVHYLRNNNLITDSKLSELRTIASEKAKMRNKQEEDQINAIYGEFENNFTNRTKSDTTANKAINNIGFNRLQRKGAE